MISRVWKYILKKRYNSLEVIMVAIISQIIYEYIIK